MASVVRNEDEILAFLLGKVTPLKASGIPVSTMVRLIRSVISDLPLKNIRGMKTPRDILSYDGQSGGVERHVPSVLPRVWVSKQSQRTEFRETAVLKCAWFADDLVNEWSEASRDTAGDLIDPASHLLLLSRKGEFYKLSCVWLPHEEWDGDVMSSRPSSFRYDLVTSTLSVTLLDDSGLEEFLGLAKPGTASILGLKVLHTLSSALRATADELNEQARLFEHHRARVFGIVERISS